MAENSTRRREQIDAEVETEIRDAMTFAENSPFPGNEELLDHVFHD